jgi:predicted transcriptional regulator
MRKPRSKQEIAAAILEALQEPKTKFQVRTESRSSYEQINSYLKMMKSSDLIQIISDNKLIITRKGKELLHLYQQAEKMF